MAKLMEAGMVEPKMRGWRQSEKVKAKDDLWRQEINKHIERFHLVLSTSKQYLHSDLTLPKMYAMFIDETSGNDKPSYSTYSRKDENAPHYTYCYKTKNTGAKNLMQRNGSA